MPVVPWHLALTAIWTELWLPCRAGASHPVRAVALRDHCCPRVPTHGTRTGASGLRTQEKSLVTSILPQMTQVFDILYITVFWSCCEVRASYFLFLKTTPKQTKTQTPGFAGLRPVYALPLPRTGISPCHDRPNQVQPCASAAPQPHIRLSKQQPGSLESKIPPKHSAGSWNMPLQMSAGTAWEILGTWCVHHKCFSQLVMWTPYQPYHLERKPLCLLSTC